MSSVNGRNYDILDIANWFHSMTHLGFDLKQIKNSTFDPVNKDYVTSLGMFAAMPVIALIVILVVYLIVSIVICFCCINSKKRKDIRIECKVFIFLFGLVCGLSFIVGLYGDWKVREGIKTIHNATEDGVSWFDEVKRETNNVTNMLDATQVLNSLEESLIKINDLHLVNVDVSPYLGYPTKISDELRNSRNQLMQTNDTINSSSINKDIESLPDYISKYGNIFFIVVLCVLLLLAIIGLLFTLAICSRCVLGCFTVLAVIALIIGSLIVALTFFSSVGVSDFCYDDKRWIKAQIEQDIINDYLVDCSSNNQIKTYLNNAGIAVKNAIDYNKDLKEFNQNFTAACNNPQLPPNTCQDIPSQVGSDLTKLENKLDIISKFVNEFKVLADCLRINTDLNNSMTSVCTDILKGVVMIFFNTIASSFCFTLLIFSATFALR